MRHVKGISRRNYARSSLRGRNRRASLPEGVVSLPHIRRWRLFKNIRQVALVAGLSMLAGAAIALAPQIIPGSESRGGGKLQGPAHIIDGDTIHIAGQRLRLAGIDAPESGQSCTTAGGESYPCGVKAGQYLTSLIGAKPLDCKGKETDRYGRLLATCYLEGRDINAAMVRAGWAVAYRRYSAQYLPEEQVASAHAAGLWQGSFEMPWAWRQDHREATRQVAAVRSDHCDIKGNISSRGKIYHVPGERRYERTRIDPSRGERWFCSETEARAAGWRPPYN